MRLTVYEKSLLGCGKEGMEQTKYRIYCNTESAFVTVWDADDIPPTTCPHDSEHSVNLDSVNAVSRLGVTLSITPHMSVASNSDYTLISTLRYDFKRGSILGFALSGFSSSVSNTGTVMIRDETNNVVIGTGNITSTQVSSVSNTELDYHPTDKFIMVAFYAKNSAASQSCTIFDISLLGEIAV